MLVVAVNLEYTLLSLGYAKSPYRCIMTQGQTIKVGKGILKSKHGLVKFMNN
jgi:hypothetical protein